MRDFSLFNRAAKETAKVTDKKCGKIARKVKNWRQFEAGWLWQLWNSICDMYYLFADDEERELQMDPADYGKQRFNDVL